MKWPFYQKHAKADNFESHNSRKHRFTKIRGFHSNFVGYESSLESSSPFLLFDETDLDYSIDSGNLYERGYRPLIQKDSVTHMHDLAVCVKETISLLRGLSVRNSVDIYLYFLFYAFSFIDHLHFSIQFFMLFHLT